MSSPPSAHVGAGGASRRIAGVGLGLRLEFDEQLIETLPAVDFLEVAPENYIGRGGYHADGLRYLAARYPILTHGLSLSVGGTDPLNERYLEGLASFIAEVGSPWHSDHLSFGTSRGRVLHDLLPIAFTPAGVRRIANRVKRVQDVIGVPLAIENISFYLPPDPTEMTEAEFIARVCEGSGCGLLLDVNNLYVNATNLGFDVHRWLDVVPLDRVVQMHVAGHEWFDEELRPSDAGSKGALIVDTHGASVPDPVLALFAEVAARMPDIPVVLERDHRIPELPDLLAEIAALKAILNRVQLENRGKSGEHLAEEPPGAASWL